jgi:hypothetical protein
MAYQEYPKQMVHPHFRAAVNSGYRRNADGSATNDPPGSPAKFPPVVVNNRDQEQDYASRGYLPAGVSDPAAYLRTTIGADAPGVYKFQEFPKWIYRVEDGELQSKMVQSEAEEARAGKGWCATPDAAWAALDEEHGTNDQTVPAAAAKKAVKTKAEDVSSKRKYTRRPAKKAEQQPQVDTDGDAGAAAAAQE